jgi:hypothetical protein
MMKRPLFLIASILILELVAVEQFTYAQNIIITKNDIGRAGTSIPVSAIGVPIGSVDL